LPRATAGDGVCSMCWYPLATRGQQLEHVIVDRVQELQSYLYFLFMTLYFTSALTSLKVRPFNEKIIYVRPFYV